MPSLSIPNVFTPFTKIVSAQMNANFTAITTLLNTTKLDDTNIQNAGITPTTKLNASGSSAGQVLTSNGSAVVWASNPLTAQFNKVLGSASDVSNGVATNSTFASITQADGDRILILPTYATTENWSVTKKLFVTGLGNTSVITGTITFATGSSKSEFINLRATDNVTINSGVNAIVIPAMYLASGKTFIDNSASTDINYLIAMQE